MSLRDILAGIGPRVVPRGRQADGGRHVDDGRMVDGWRCCESASCATGGLHGGQVAPGFAPVVSLSVCGVTVQLHCDRYADLVPLGLGGICLSCDWCVA